MLIFFLPIDSIPPCWTRINMFDIIHFFLYLCLFITTFPSWGVALMPFLYHHIFLLLFSHRLWSSWIPNFSPCSKQSRLTGLTGRNWTGRDSVARASLRRPAPAAATSQRRLAVLWPKRAARPAAAPMLTAQHANLLVSFGCPLWAAILGFLPVKCSLPLRRCSACRGSWALLPLLEMSFRLVRGASTESFLSSLQSSLAEGWQTCVWQACRRGHRSADDTSWEEELKPLCQHVNQWANTNYSGHCTDSFY